ncbi:hypothetical protein CLAIMM_03044 [Cladophialophora immunda]|nr:hypothetical protein CLAIMM_03044 [Cladophialophora immunda]
MAKELPYLYLVVLVLGVYGFYRLLQVGKRDPRMPKGPPTLPILGNFHQIPSTGMYRQFREWAKEYGSVFSLKFGPSNIIVLCDREAIHELLNKKGSIYSDRPTTYVGNLLTKGDHIAISQADALWREKRKEAEGIVLMNDLLTNPDGFFNHIRRYTASVATTLVYGQRGATFDSFWAHGVFDVMAKWTECMEPGANPPVDEYKFLQWLPASFAHWKKRAIQAGDTMDAVWDRARQIIDTRRTKGNHRDCIADHLLDEYYEKGFPMSQHAFNNLIGELVEGGADTTAAQLLTMVLALARNPWVQKKAREEIDPLCGAHRSPEMSKDFEKLPYINAIVKEGMRWRPVAVTALPHKVRQDDYYKGMLIPKDSTVFIPTWAIHHSPDIYPNDEDFNPDRFLNYPRLSSDYHTIMDMGRLYNWGCAMVAGSGSMLFAQTGFIDYFRPSATVMGAIGSSYFGGVVVGLIIITIIAQKLGRKRSIQLGGLIGLVGAIMQTAAQDMAVFFVGRVVAGAASGIMLTTVNVYQSEIAPPAERGAMVAFQLLVLSGAGGLASWVGFACNFSSNVTFSWRFPIALQMLPAIFLIIGCFFIPFSPRWLISQDRHTEAQAVLKRLHDNHKDPLFWEKEYLQISAQLAEEAREKASSSWLHMLTNKREAKRILVAVAALTLLQTNGAQTIQVYQIILTVGCLVGLLLIDRIGRRLLLLGSFVILSICLGIFAGCTAKYQATGESSFGKGGVAIVMIFIFFFGSVSGAPYAYAAEVLPTKNRAIGFAMGLFCSNAITIIFTQTAPMALEAITWKFNFVFICCNAFFFPIVCFFFPETKVLTLEEVNAAFGDKLYALRKLFALATRLLLPGRRLSLETLSLWVAISQTKLDNTLPMGYSVPISVLVVLTGLPSALWAGALTPILAMDAQLTGIISIPQFSSRSHSVWASQFQIRPLYNNVTKEYDMQVWNILDNCTEIHDLRGTIPTCPVPALQGPLLASAGSATTVDVSIARVHSKIDSNGSSGVALIPVETNDSGNTWYVLSGALPNEPPGTVENFGLASLNNNPSLLTWAARSYEGNNMVVIAASEKDLDRFNQTQCSITFTPTIFDVRVNITSKTVRVEEAETGTEAEDFEPTGDLVFGTVQSLNLLGRMSNSFYTSVLGNALLSNVYNMEFQRNKFSTQDNSVLLAAVEESYAAMIDDILVAYGASQLLNAQDTKETVVVGQRQAVHIGKHIWIYFTLAFNGAIVLVFLLELIRTRFWSGLSRFDYTNIKCTITAASAGGMAIANKIVCAPDRQGKQDGESSVQPWDGSPSDPAFEKTIIVFSEGSAASTAGGYGGTGIPTLRLASAPSAAARLLED